MVNISKKERAQGSFLASAIGDALGWPNEMNAGRQGGKDERDYKFISWKRKDKNPFWHVEAIKQGSYSDDTQLMLAVARSLLTNDWKTHLTSVEYPFWIEYERGAGRAVKKAAVLWKNKDVPWKNTKYLKDYFMAGGNGGAMRILPHIIRGYEKDPKDLINEVIDDVILSHGHPRAILGATCYAYALYYLFTKEGKLGFAELAEALYDARKVWGAAPDQNRFGEWLFIAQNQSGYVFSDVWNDWYTSTVNMLKYVKDSLESGLLSDDRLFLENIGAFSPKGGAGDIAIASAVYFFSKYANTPELAVGIPAYMMGIDTDTIASMTGGLIGVFLGTEWIPVEWRSVQDYAYINELAYNLLKGDKVHNLEVQLITVDQMDLMDSIDYGGKYSVLRIDEYRTSFGQTVFIKTGIPIAEKDSLRKKKKGPDKIQLSIASIEKAISEKSLYRVSLRKALEVVLLYNQGVKEELIINKTKLDCNTVKSIGTILLKHEGE